MDSISINTTAVIGAGTMGQGIAQVLAMHGYTTLLFDKDPAALKRAISGIERNLEKGIQLGKLSSEEKKKTLTNIRLTEKFSELKADLIIEAVIEDLAVKQDLFKELEKINTRQSVLATNTSSIPVSQIASILVYPERFIGLHFFNPAHLMKLVEIISGVATSDALLSQMKDFGLTIGKVPVISKDSPGFIVNRVARHFYVESLKIAEENVADFETIDKLVESYGFKMGPFRLMDLIGIDTNFAVTKSMYNSFHQDPKFRPSRLQEQKVMAGQLGRKSSLGFYDYRGK